MSIIHVLLTGDLVGGTRPFELEHLLVQFDRLSGTPADQLFDGAIWAFVDWVPSELSGLEMCRRLRSDIRTSEAHITIVLEDDDVELRRRALRAGADDYIVGPLDRRQVLDRILATQLGTAPGAGAKKITLGELALDVEAMLLRYQGRPVPLMPNELRLMRFFMERPGQVFTRDRIIRGLGKQEPAIDERTVDVWIGRLRRALRAAGAGDLLRTVRRVGYVLDQP
jgi:two-component system, OmpR family, phosphate regulon response regulator PhoB